MKKEKHIMSSEDLSLSEKEFVAKYSVSRATYYRAKKSGYYIPKYHEHLISVDPVFLERNWNLIIKCSTIAARIIIKEKQSAAFGKLFQFNDLKNEALIKIVEKSGEMSTEIKSLKGFMIFIGVCAIRDFLKGKLYRYANHHSELNDNLSFQPNILDNVNTEKFIEDIKQAIISRYGEYGWEEVWKWANSDIRKVSKKIQTILSSITN